MRFHDVVHLINLPFGRVLIDLKIGDEGDAKIA
jgi:hypothetical protein